MFPLRRNRYGLTKHDCCFVATGHCPIAKIRPNEIWAMYHRLGCGTGFGDETDKRYCVFLASKLLSDKLSDQCYRMIALGDGRHRRCIVDKLAKQGIQIDLIER